MPDYNLGRAHGTIRVDYDGRGVEQADDDLKKVGDTAETTGQKISESTDRSSADYDNLALAARRLQQEVARAAAAEISARARVVAAQQQLISVQNDAAAGARDLLNAQRQLTAETSRYERAVDRARTANRALSDVQRELGSQRRPDLTPTVDTSRLDEIIRRLSSIDSSSRKSVFGLNAFSGRLRAMIGLAALAAPGIAGLAVSLASLTGLVGVAAGGVASLVAVVGTLVTAMSGLGEVFKTANQQAASAGQSAIQLASQQRAAARQIEQAIRSVRDAEEALAETRRSVARGAVQAAQQIVQAERQLRDVQKDALRAQENLTRARREAARQLEDLRSQLIGGALDERQAIIDVERAQEELNQTRADPRSSSTDVDQAVLNLEKQQKALEDTRRQNQRLRQDDAETSAKGVENSDRVVDAKEEVLHTEEAVGDAAVAVAEAVVAAAQQQIDAQIQIRNATEAVADAQADLAEAYLQAADVGAGAAAKMADALANISPEAREFVQAILAQRDAWKEVKFAVQDALFAGLAEEFSALASKWLPLLRTGMVGVAGELRGLIVELMRFLQTGEATGDVALLFENTRQAVDNITPGIHAILDLFLDLSAVGSSFLPEMAAQFSNWAENLSRVAEKSREAGEMRAWMQEAISTLGQLWELLGNVASIIGTIFTAFDQAGGGALTTLVNLTQRLEDFLKTAEGQEILKALGKTLAALASLLGDVLIGALTALGPAFVALAPLIQQFASLLGQHILVTAQLLAPVLKLIADILAFMGPVLVPLIASMVFLNKAITIAITVWKILNSVMRTNPFLLIAAAIVALAFFIIENWEQIVAFLTEVWERIKSIAGTIWEGIRKAIVDPIVAAFNWLVDKFQEFDRWATGLWLDFLQMISNILSRVKSAIIDPIGQAVESVINFFRNLPGKVLSFLSDIPRQMYNAGLDILKGLLNGLGAMAGHVINFFKNLIGDAVDGVLDFLGIGSPSKLFRDIGEFTLQGYVVGVDRMEDSVLTRMVEVAAAITTAGTPEQLVPAGAVPAPRIAPDASGTADDAIQRSITVQTLNLTVAGNLDPTDKVRWRKAIKGIKKGIEDVERSDEP